MSAATVFLVQLLVAILVATAGVFAYRYWLRCQNYRRAFRRMNGPRWSLPVIGDILYFIGPASTLLKRIVNLCSNYGPRPFRFWLAEELFIVMTRPEDLEVVMSSQKMVNKPETAYGVVQGVFGKGLITISGESWRRHRRILTPAFHFKVLDRYAEIFMRRARVLSEQRFASLPQDKSFDAMSEFSPFVTETIWETAFGLEEKVIDDPREKEVFMAAVHESFKVISKRIEAPWLHSGLLFWLSPLYRPFKRAEHLITSIGNKIIQLKRKAILEHKYRERLAGNEASKQDDDDVGLKKRVAFLDLVLEQDGELLSDAEILEEVRTLIAVQQTSATTLSFTLVLLALHQDVQERVAREVLDVAAEGLPIFEALGKMKYLERVLKESLRLFPNTPLIARTIGEDLTLPDGETIPAGNQVSMFLYLTHRDPNHWPDAERFDPDNFLPERCAGRHPYAFVPFSAGPRNCIGQRYAMLQMKAVLSQLLSRHHFLPGDGCEAMDKLRVNMDTFLHLTGGFNVRVQPRVHVGGSPGA